MCDTLYKRGNETVVFGKNSDRSCNEPNLVVFSPARTGEGELKCTYIIIPDAPSLSAILVKPSWIWGAEMGINSCGVAIGNEAVFTKTQSKIPSLIGMDYLRLALERGKTASEAAEVIIFLLGKYGQGGNCGFDKNFFYDNSYLIADKNEAYILETAGKDYALKKINCEGNISNRLSIETDYDKCSLPEGSNFKKTFSDILFTKFSASEKRMDSGTCALSSFKNIDVSSMMSALRGHLPVSLNKLFSKGSVGSVCMHQSALGDHTTGSFVVDLNADYPTVWVTGSSTPCQAVFKPVFFDGRCAPLFDDPKSSLNYWLEREYVNRAIFSGFIDREKHIKEAKSLEDSFILEEKQLRTAGASRTELASFAKKCSLAEQAFIDGYGKVTEKIKNGEIYLKGQWNKRTLNLGKNVFDPDLKNRKG